MTPLTVDASGAQIHCRASLDLIAKWVNDHMAQVGTEWGHAVASRVGSAAGLALIDELEERLTWPTRDMITWERSVGFDPNYVLTRTRRRVNALYNIEDAIEGMRAEFEGMARVRS